MRNIILALVTGVALMASAVAANAAPMTAVFDASQTPAITYVAGGCGPVSHRDRFGACVPNGVFRPGPRCMIRPTPMGPRRICR